MKKPLPNEVDKSNPVDGLSSNVLSQNSTDAGLTDDERSRREHDASEEGSRVTLGPADADRLSKKK